MKYTNFLDLFDLEGIELALLSTFNFDPDFFERRLLAESSLIDARRIAVFMDCGQWHQLMSEDIPARLINQRYLVVPVRHTPGVFHPKLHICLSNQGARVLCGSGNLTRAGCTHNLELANSVPICWNEKEGVCGSVGLAEEVLTFFETAADRSDGDSGAIAKKWIQDYRRAVRWKSPANASGAESGDLPIRLLHTYAGKLWDGLLESLGTVAPDRLVAISPYFDEDAALILRAKKMWPRCRLEVVAQQHTSTLPVEAIKRARCRLSLFEVTNASRRLHAKLVGWEANGSSGCIVGSANFTTAAWDGRNVEACLYLSNASDGIASLFDSKLPRKEIALADFISGTEIEPRSSESGAHALALESAVVDRKGHLKIVFKCEIKPLPKTLTMRIRLNDPRRMPIDTEFPLTDGTKATLQFPENDSQSGLLGSLVGRAEGHEIESTPVWIILEDQLTYEGSEGGTEKGGKDKRQTGWDLPEVLEQIRATEGVAEVIKHLDEFSISFSDGMKRLGLGRAGWGRSEPFHEDVLPAWIRAWESPGSELHLAIYRFARRHEDKCLSRHAERANIDGMGNFLDIFVAIVRLLFVFYARKVVEKHVLLRHLISCIGIATNGIKTELRSSDGYLLELSRKYGGVLKEECESLNFTGYLYATLVIAHVVSHELDRPGKASGVRGKLWLPGTVANRRFGFPGVRKPDPLKEARSDVAAVRTKVRDTLTAAGVALPSGDDVAAALESFEMMPEDALACYKSHIGKILCG